MPPWSCPRGPAPTTSWARCGRRPPPSAPPTPSRRRVAPAALAVLADLRTGLAGGAEERDSGDGAAAFVFGPDGGDAPVVAELVAHAAVSAEFLDRWRTPGDADSKVWEERFGQEVYVPLVEAATAEALKRAGIVAADVDHLAVAGLHVRAVQAVGRSLGTRPEALVADRSSVVGNLGAAQAGMLLADVLDRAAPGAIDRPGGGGRRGRRVRAPGHRRASLRAGRACVPGGGDGRRVGGRRPGRPAVCPVPDLARRAPARAAPSARPGAAGRTGDVAGHALEVGLHGQRLPSVRLPSPAPVPGLPAVPDHRRDGPGAHGRRPRAGGHVHRGPPRLQPVAPGGRGGGGLRRGWSLPLRDDRRRPRRAWPSAPAWRWPSGGSSTAKGVHNYFWKARPVATPPDDGPARTEEETHEQQRDP